VNRNDLTMGMKQIVRDTSAYYLLGYNSTFTATDGKFHEIRVRVKRPGVQVRARKGYWAFTAEDAKRALEPPKNDTPKAVDAAIASIATAARSRLVRTWVGTDRGPSGKTKVTVVWEAIARPPGSAARASEVPARLSVTAVAPDGAPYFRGRTPDAVQAPPTSGSAAGGAVSFDAAPGKMQLRLAVESAESDVLDSEIREVAVPDLTAPDAGLATPLVFRARTVREYQQMRSDPTARPTAAREFSRAERVYLRVSRYTAADAPLTARLLNRSGQSIGDLVVAPAANGNADSRDIELSLATLAPGEYVVEITAQGAPESKQELIGFRVTG
jgi:hypothetical protein